MGTTVFVISDLHLGGKPGFDMCPAKGQARLAEFLRYVAGQKTSTQDIRLVVNGDIIDFLAETDENDEFCGFTQDQRKAIYKVDEIVKRTQVVWDAFHDVAEANCGITLLLGNHDVELALPRVRQYFLDVLGKGRIDFVYDNQALSLGKGLVIEHGNRYDPWNVVPHDTLRRIRSRLSRGEDADAPEYVVQPGSRLVVDVMNNIKKNYPWVDLLKPETAGLISLLRVFGAVAKRDVIRTLRDTVVMANRWMQFDMRGLPTDNEYVNAAIAKGASAGVDDSSDDEFVSASRPSQTDDISELSEPGNTSDITAEKLLDAFRKRAEKDKTTFNVDRENEIYLSPARVLAQHGYKVIVFGHTHLAKRYPLGEAVYLNTGTWADLMRVPESAYTGPREKALADLKLFLAALGSKQIDRYRRQVPTYAKVDLGPSGAILGRDVFFFDGMEKPQTRLETSEMLARLESQEA